MAMRTIRLLTLVLPLTLGARAQLSGLEQDGFADLRRRIAPILKDIATERHLEAIFNTPESGVSYVDPRVDVSAEVAKRLDAAASRK